MLALAAVLLDPTEVKPATFTDLAGAVSAIPLVLVKAGDDAVPLFNHRRVIEALSLQSSVLMLFENVGEAEAFEKARSGSRRCADARRVCSAHTATTLGVSRTR